MQPSSAELTSHQRHGFQAGIDPEEYEDVEVPDQLIECMRCLQIMKVISYICQL